MHARYLPRRAVERRAKCGGKIAPLQRRQVRCVCVRVYMCLRVRVRHLLGGETGGGRSCELPGNNSVCEISRMYFDSSRTSERFRVRTRGTNTNTSVSTGWHCSSPLSLVSPSSFSAHAFPTGSLSLLRALFLLFLSLRFSPLLSLPSCRGNMTIIRYEATSRRI